MDQQGSTRKVANIESVSTADGNLTVRGEDSYYQLEYYKSYFVDGQAYSKFIKGVEKACRTSEDYKRYIGYVRNEVGLDRCSFLGNVEGEVAELEFHHYPFTLYECASIITDHVIARGGKVSTLSVAKELMDAHYRNLVGGVMLSKTAHDLAHAGKLFVNLNQVFGNVNGFVERYKDGITQETADSLNELVELSEKHAPNGGVFKVDRAIWNVQGLPPVTYDEIDQII